MLARFQESINKIDARITKSELQFRGELCRNPSTPLHTGCSRIDVRYPAITERLTGELYVKLLAGVDRALADSASRRDISKRLRLSRSLPDISALDNPTVTLNTVELTHESSSSTQ